MIARWAEVWGKVMAQSRAHDVLVRAEFIEKVCSFGWWHQPGGKFTLWTRSDMDRSDSEAKEIFLMAITLTCGWLAYAGRDRAPWMANLHWRCMADNVYKHVYWTHWGAQHCRCEHEEKWHLDIKSVFSKASLPSYTRFGRCHLPANAISSWNRLF